MPWTSSSARSAGRRGWRPSSTSRALGVAVRGLEGRWGEGPGSPFAAALKSAAGAIEQLTVDVEANYKRPLV